MKVYLCGPINGCTDDECINWREYAKEHLDDTLDPMRRDYRGIEADGYREIVDLDKLDVRESDALLVYHPQPSVGTAMEVYMAWQLGNPIVIVYEGKVSPWLRYHSTKLCESFSEAISWLRSLQ